MLVNNGGYVALRIANKQQRPPGCHDRVSLARHAQARQPVRERDKQRVSGRQTVAQLMPGLVRQHLQINEVMLTLEFTNLARFRAVSDKQEDYVRAIS